MSRINYEFFFRFTCKNRAKYLNKTEKSPNYFFLFAVCALNECQQEFNVSNSGFLINSKLHALFFISK